MSLTGLGSVLAVCCALGVGGAVVARTGATVGQQGSSQAGMSGVQRDQQAEQLLARARNTLGDSRRLASVTALLIETDERTEPVKPRSDSHAKTAPEPTSRCVHRVLMPDRYQRVLVDGPVMMVHTLDGPDYWSLRRGPKPSPELETVLYRMANDPAEQAVVRESLERAFGGVMLALTARAPVSLGYGVRYMGATTLDGKRVETVGFERGGRTDFTLLLDAETLRPRALVQTLTNPPIEAIERLSDYRDVSGIRLPFRLELTLPQSRHVTTVRKAAINPPLTPVDFAKTR